MSVGIFPPLEIQNLLPYDLTYRLFDKQTKRDYKAHLRKGLSGPVHGADLSHLLALSIEMPDTGLVPVLQFYFGSHMN